MKEVSRSPVPEKLAESISEDGDGSTNPLTRSIALKILAHQSKSQAENLRTYHAARQERQKFVKKASEDGLTAKERSEMVECGDIETVMGLLLGIGPRRTSAPLPDSLDDLFPAEAVHAEP